LQGSLGIKRIEVLKNSKKKNLIQHIQGAALAPELMYKFALSKVRGTLGLPRGHFVKFRGVGNKDVYNTSGPFYIGESQFIAGRVESREMQDAFTMFFRNTGYETWTLDSAAPVFELEDPFQAWIDGQLIVGGVRTLRDPNGIINNYFTVFYRGTDVYNLQEFAHGPVGMKDIRLIELPPTEKKPKQILVFGRPQGHEAGRGKVSTTVIENLDQLNPENINKAIILGTLSEEGEWAGVNDLYLLPDGTVGVLYHIARAEKTKRFYNAATMIYDPRDGAIKEKKVIATREAFPNSPVKMLRDCINKDDLKEVIFPSRLILNSSYALLYGGLSDTTTGVLRCPNPFKQQYKKQSNLVGRLTGGRLNKIL
jgi:hypothetical protein